MQRPTSVQFAYGSVTVVLSTLALLLLTQAESALSVALVSVGSLTLGLLVAVRTPVRRPHRGTAARPTTTGAVRTAPATLGRSNAGASGGSWDKVRETSPLL